MSTRPSTSCKTLSFESKSDCTVNGPLTHNSILTASWSVVVIFSTKCIRINHYKNYCPKKVSSDTMIIVSVLFMFILDLFLIDRMNFSSFFLLSKYTKEIKNSFPLYSNNQIKRMGLNDTNR